MKKEREQKEVSKGRFVLELIANYIWYYGICTGGPLIIISVMGLLVSDLGLILIYIIGAGFIALGWKRSTNVVFKKFKTDNSNFQSIKKSLLIFVIICVLIKSFSFVKPVLGLFNNINQEMQLIDDCKVYEQLFSTGDETSSSDDNSEIKDVVKETFNMASIIATSGSRNLSLARMENYTLKFKSYLSLLVVVFFLCEVIMPFFGYKYECDLLEEKFYM